MKNDKAWLIQKVSDIFWRVEIDDDFNIQNANIMFDDISNLIDQLDEPEVLSQECIDKKRLIERVENYIPLQDKTVGDVIDGILEIVKQLPEMEVLSPEWIEAHSYVASGLAGFEEGQKFVRSDALQNLLVPKHEEVDRAYNDGYEKGKEYTFCKGYLEGLADKESEPETVADVISDFWKSFERLKEVMSMEVEELESERKL